MSANGDIPEDVVLRDANGKVMTEAQLNTIATYVFDSTSLVKHCEVDGKPIKMIAFRGTGVCCELCRKIRDGQVTEEEAAEIRAKTRRK